MEQAALDRFGGEPFLVRIGRLACGLLEEALKCQLDPRVVGIIPEAEITRCSIVQDREERC
jgi:hypothetical protein